MSEARATICPNCQKPAIRTGNEITCENCDTVFVITRKQEVEVKEFGAIKDHEKRIQVLEQFIPKGSAEQQESEQAPEQEPDEDEDI